ncbi:MAG TPA: hypothetical protein DD420_35075 [Streptomyces sp.]|nr:hypothetical protein [Streptomyces sp.]
MNWQPLRRFRRLPAGKQVTHGQANGVRIEVRYAVRLLEWLRLNGSSFAQCTQDHVDTWLSDGPALRSSVRAFLLWTSRRGHTRPLTAPRPFVSGVFDTRTLAATSASLSGTEGKPNERLDRGPPE